ncbi:MAG: mannose-6-phosphate isomerase [Paludibacter sp. 47-17]|nr:MAG: mannose-6-phosphate isomerase [Paludibacter sp. 47-17]
MILLDDELLNELTAQASVNQRLRINYNLHDSLEAPVQRLLNAMEPGTVLPVHRHIDTAETYLILRGRLKVLMYSDSGVLTSVHELNPLQGVYGINVPAGQWHTVEVLEKGTVIFEVKEGPYRPLSEEHILTV